MHDQDQIDHDAATALTGALIIAQAISGGTPQQLQLTPQRAAALRVACYDAIVAERKKRE